MYYYFILLIDSYWQLINSILLLTADVKDEMNRLFLMESPYTTVKRFVIFTGTQELVHRVSQYRSGQSVHDNCQIKQGLCDLPPAHVKSPWIMRASLAFCLLQIRWRAKITNWLLAQSVGLLQYLSHDFSLSLSINFYYNNTLFNHSLTIGTTAKNILFEPPIRFLWKNNKKFTTTTTTTTTVIIITIIIIIIVT